MTVAIKREAVLHLWQKGLRAREITAAIGCSTDFVEYSLEWKRKQPGFEDFGYRCRKRKEPSPVHQCICGDHAWAVLSRGFVTLVSPEDSHHLEGEKWCAFRQPYGGYYASRSRYPQGCRYLHRDILNAPSGIEVDHINHCGLDNRRPNIRLATKQQNAFNRKKRPGSVESQYIGVRNANRTRRWPLKKPWAAVFERKHLGYFATEIEAAVAYDAEARKARGQFAALNLPDTPALVGAAR